MARPKGTTDLARAQKRVQMQDVRIIGKVSDCVLDAFNIITEIMANTEASDTTRLSAAKTVVDMHKSHVKEATKSKVPSVQEATQERLQQAQTTISDATKPMLTLTDTFPE